MLSAYEISHQTAITHYLTAKNYHVEVKQNIVTASKNGQYLTAAFDDQNRLCNLTSDIKS
jgi:hypothetical protein